MTFEYKLSNDESPNRITIHVNIPNTYITDQEYDFNVNDAVSGKFKVIKTEGENVTMELDEQATAAYQQLLTQMNNRLQYFSFGTKDGKL